MRKSNHDCHSKRSFQWCARGRERERKNSRVYIKDKKEKMRKRVFKERIAPGSRLRGLQQTAARIPS